MKIYYKSDFELIETFLDVNEDPIDLSTINFKIEYYTLGQNVFIASKTGSTFVNCQIDESDSSKLIVIFKNHKLAGGTLQREITLFVGNALFESTQKVMFNPISDIELVLKGGEQGTAEAIVVYPVIMPEPTYYDIKDLADSTGLRAEWSGKQDALTADVDYLTPSTAGTTYEPKKSTGENYVSDAELEVLQNTSGENTGDETAETILNKIGNGEQISSEYLPSYVDDVIEGYYFESAFYEDSAHTELIIGENGKVYIDLPTNNEYRWGGSVYVEIGNPPDFATQAEAEAGTSEAKEMNPLRVFQAIIKYLTAVTISTLNTTSKFIVGAINELKSSNELKADITPANGTTSALTALFVARSGGDMTYNSTTGFFEMFGINDITLTEAMEIYSIYPVMLQNNLTSAFASEKRLTCRTVYRLPMTNSFAYTANQMFLENTYIQIFRQLTRGVIPPNFTNTALMFYGATNLVDSGYFYVATIASAGSMSLMYFGCTKLVTSYLFGLKVNFSYADCPLLSLASLTYLVANRGNATTRITITVHATVWAKLNDAVNYPTWNALLVDAANNRYIVFESA